MSIKTGERPKNILIMKFKNYNSALIPLAIYLIIAYVTQLDWDLFKDEPLYIKATTDFLNAIPNIKFPLNFSGSNIIIWAWLTDIFGFNIPLLRLSSICFVVVSNLFLIKIAKQLDFKRPWHCMILVASLPQVFIYTFQVNGTALNICLSVVIIYFVTQYHSILNNNKSSVIILHLLMLLICLSAASINNPFLLAYPAAIIVTVGMELFKERNEDRRKKQFLIISSSLLSIFLWAVFIFLSEVSTSESLKSQESPLLVNPKFIILYLGHIFLFFSYVGGMFPFLPFVISKRLNAKIMATLIALGIILALQWLPVNDYAYASRFHTLFTMVLDRAVHKFNFPLISVNLFYLLLVGLGIYNFSHLIYLSQKDSFFYFSVVTILFFMSLMLLDPYVSSRLYLPAMIGLFVLIAKMYEKKSKITYIQISYQIFWVIAYTISLKLKYGFLR